MYGMIPFGRMNTSWNDLFDDFERRMFPADRSELPAFRTDIRDEGGKLIAALRTVMYLTGRPLEL